MFYRAYQESLVNISTAQKMSLKVLYLLYAIPLSSMSLIRHFTNGNNGINVEIAADQVVVEYGYRDELSTAINAIVKAYGNSNLGKTYDEKYHEIQESVNWATLNIVDVLVRQKSMKDRMYVNSIKVNSIYIKTLYKTIMNRIGISLKEKYKGIVCEATLDILMEDGVQFKYDSVYDRKIFGKYETQIKNIQESNHIATESSKTDRQYEKNFPSQYEIDLIEVEADRVENHHDRMYVLDLIYVQMDKIQFVRDNADCDPKCKRLLSKVNGYEKQLNEIRMNVLRKKNLDKEYKLFVKYPVGYEG